MPKAENRTRTTPNVSRLGELRFPCELCGESAGLARSASTHRPGAFGRVASKDPTSSRYDPKLVHDDAPENLFWACLECHRDVDSWGLQRLRDRLHESRQVRPSPALFRVAPPQQASTREVVPDTVDPALESAVGITVDQLGALYVLDSVKGFGPQKFRELHDHQLRAIDVVRNPGLIPTSGKRGSVLRSQLKDTLDLVGPECRARAVRQILAAHRVGATILTYGHQKYPRSVLESNNPVPILYARGALDVLAESRTVACVGSRKTSGVYAHLHAEFARTACRLGFTIVSGFALGADTIGHDVAWRGGGRTICVMPGGLDRPFPPENRVLWDALLSYSGAAFVSEFPFGTAAAALTLRKRNKLIVAFARGVLVSQTSSDGGAMNAYRFALEQRKQVATFAHDGSADTSGNRVIAEDRKAGGICFPTSPSADAYEQWLRQLSYST